MRASAAAGTPRPTAVLRRACAHRRARCAGGFLLGLSTFQAEFDFGVPQFRFVFQPMLIMLAAGVGARRRAACGSAAARALGAVAFFLVIRGVPGADRRPGASARPTPHMPLYLVEALLVEARRAARRHATARWPSALWSRRRRSAPSGWRPSGRWSHVWMPLPWPDDAAARGARCSASPRRRRRPARRLGRHARCASSAARAPRALRRGGGRSAPLRWPPCVVFALQKPADSGGQRARSR